MEALLLLIALTAVFGVLVAPALRRRRLRKEAEGGMRQTLDPSSGYGFVPPQELDVRLPGPDPELLEALEETQRTQDWGPVARMLALTSDEWELRWQRVQSLAGAAAMELSQARAGGLDTADATSGEAPGGPSLSKEPRPRDARWLRNWRAQQPGDAGGAQVYAQFLVWQAVADPASEDHRIVLEEARNICRDAAALDPRDPTPHITELFVARYLGYRTADFESLWSEVRRRAPHHMGAHLVALPYWSQQDSGAKERADAFARTAAAQAPEGTLLPALPLFATYAHLPEVNMVRGLYQSAEIETAIEAAEFAVDQVEDGHPVRPHVLHLLVCFLVRAERYREAMEALSVVDGYVGALPWADSADPATEYAGYRALAVAGWEATGGSRAQQPPTS
ncbi:hypothetical protein E0L36_26305 [Streptomyces sp. AJS327]|uniref:hypothetical protein n=1 Tax=Streptomyces sp. AJS327 TaxID=2545265 RepID=UPI0015DDE6B0|nr:hypothetical protein [Streptomyces sp. AJS327]MBA0054239.1 hypothetical protein [Streptomyces sp. AJS327]UYV85212.1 hypothetical protein [Streptomyces sp. AJS327]